MSGADSFIHLYLPGDSGKSSPTLLLLHGTGGTENDLIAMGKQILPGANLLSVRGNVVENGMSRFFRRFAEGVFDEEDIRFRAGELAEFVIATSARYDFDAGSAYAVGYSNGANIAAAMALLQPESLAGGVLLRAMVPLTPSQIPDLSGKTFAIHSGEVDPIVPLESANRLAAMLRQSGASVAHHVFLVGHSLISEDVDNTKSWFRDRMI